MNKHRRCPCLARVCHCLLPEATFYVCCGWWCQCGGRVNTPDHVRARERGST